MTFWLVLFGFLSGIIGGMGMGGGTLLVPLLSFLDIPQKTVQAINLIGFLPMCCVALAFHSKNRLIKTENVGWVVLPASVFAVIGAFFAGWAKNEILRLCFAVFLISVGIWQLALAVRFAAAQKRRLTVLYSPVRCLKGKNKTGETHAVRQCKK